MNVENLGMVFENFKTDSNRAILLDGPWGVGKTYQILQFLKKDPSINDKEKNRIIYVSLFGKTTIDEIHTDIYSKLYPLKNGAKRAIQVIPKVAPLFGTVGNIISNMEFALNTDENKFNALGKNIEKVSQKVEIIANDINSASDSKSKVRKSKNRTIVVFDDLERIDPQKMSFGDILGYINNLFLQNIKVIVICNSKEIKDEHFISFKEKVFDREYKISATNDQIISSYFGD
ncbi:MAG: AAA family ATPase, partial [Clostridia bacterium]|nr:AAA family ATPase [Clostridia bacterium]